MSIDDLKIIIISSYNDLSNEDKIVNELFDLGFDFFHLKKSHWNEKKILNFIEKINPDYHKKIILHSYHKIALKYKLGGIYLTRKHKKNIFSKSLRYYYKWKYPEIKITTTFHSLNQLEKAVYPFDYVFLSPVFNSISKSKYYGKFDNSKTKKILSETEQNVIALGGVCPEKIFKIKYLGFAGLAFLGYLWSDKNPVNNFLKFKNFINNEF